MENNNLTGATYHYVIMDEFSNMSAEELNKLKNMENNLKEGWAISFDEEYGYGKPYYATKEEALSNAKDALFNDENERYDLFHLDEYDQKTLEEKGYLEKRVWLGMIRLLTPEKLAKYIDFGGYTNLSNLEEELAENSITYEESLLPEHDDYSDIDLIIAKALFEKYDFLCKHTYLDVDGDEDTYVYTIQITKEDINKYKEQYE